VKLFRTLFVGSSAVLAAVVVGSLWLISPASAAAQSVGNNAVYNSSGSNTTGSPAYIDASAFTNINTDICQTLYNIISGSSYPSTGAVVDARGINALNSKTGASNSAYQNDMVCAGTPWKSGSSGTVTPNPATILLPAGYTLGAASLGTGNIIISQTWVLPNGSKIIGEGPNPGVAGTIRAFATLEVCLNSNGSSCFTGSAMIQMGNSSCPTVSGAYICTGIAVEHISLEAQNLAVDGIDNLYGQQGSYVNDVLFSDIGGTGLNIFSTAPGSGPYTDMYFSAGSSCSGASCVCVTLQAGTLGIHGMSCIGNYSYSTGGAQTAIYANAGSNRIEDVHIEGFRDGIRIGDVSSGTVSAIVVSNVEGGWSPAGPVQNTIHICGPQTSSTFGSCTNTTATVSDVVVLEAIDSGNSDGDNPDYSTIIEDDVTGTSIIPVLPPHGQSAPASAAMYALGEEVGGSGSQYSRFSTSPSSSSGGVAPYSTAVPTWAEGALSGSISGDSCTVPGALYSNTTSSGSAIYVCKWSNGSLQWETVI
jgi:hypothetical protein